MPRFDGTGPMGYGPGTGWGMGSCARGLGRRRFYTQKEESEILSQEAEAIENELKAIKERLAEVKGRK